MIIFNEAWSTPAAEDGPVIVTSTFMGLPLKVTITLTNDNPIRGFSIQWEWNGHINSFNWDEEPRADLEEEVELEILTFILLLLVTGILIVNVYNYNQDKYTLECQVLDLYQTSAGYKVSAKFLAIVKVNPYNAITELNLNPSTYYKCKQSLQNNKSIKFKFSTKQIGGFQGIKPKWYNNQNILVIILSILAITLAIGLGLWLYSILND